MSDIAKCPICGDDPGVWFDMFDKRHCNPQRINCCGVECSTPQLWDQYATAMELAKALNEMDKLDAEMRSTGCVSDELRNKRISAHRRICNAMDKRAEVFK